MTTGVVVTPQQEEMSSSVSEQVSEETSTSTEEKPRRRRSSRHGAQQLVVQTVNAEGTVECQLLCKQKTISFKFNRFDTSPNDIVEGLIKEELFKHGNQKILTDQLKDVIRQLLENPDKVPVVHVPYVQKVSGGVFMFFFLDVGGGRIVFVNFCARC